MIYAHWLMVGMLIIINILMFAPIIMATLTSSVITKASNSLAVLAKRAKSRWQERVRRFV